MQNGINVELAFQEVARLAHEWRKLTGADEKVDLEDIAVPVTLSTPTPPDQPTGCAC